MYSVECGYSFSGQHLPSRVGMSARETRGEGGTWTTRLPHVRVNSRC